MSSAELQDLVDQIDGITLLEDPFKWNIEYDEDNVITRLKDKCKDKFSKFSYKLFVCNLCLAYELYKIDKRVQAFKQLKGIEIELMDENEDALVFSMIDDAIKHVLYSSIAIVMDSLDKKDEAEQMRSKIIQFNDMNKSNRAGVIAINASVMMEYGIKSVRQARHLIEKAIALDPDNVHWHFLKGKILLRIRHVDHPYELPSSEELEEFKLCYKDNEQPMYMVFAAETFRDMACSLFHNKTDRDRDLSKGIDDLNKTAHDLYHKCASQSSISPSIMFRCAKGFLKLPHPYRDVDLAKTLLDRGVKENRDDVFGRHMLAHYYEKVDKNLAMAKEHLEFCVEQDVFGAWIDIIRVNYKITKDYKPAIEMLNKMFTKFTEESYQLQILCQMASILLFMSVDMPVVVKCLMKIMEVNPKCRQVVDHYNILCLMKSSASLYALVISKINVLLKDDSCSIEMKEQFEQFLNSVSSHGISTDAPEKFYETILYVNKPRSTYATRRNQKPRGHYPGGRSGNCNSKTFYKPKENDGHENNSNNSRIFRPRGGGGRSSSSADWRSRDLRIRNAAAADWGSGRLVTQGPNGNQQTNDWRSGSGERSNSERWKTNNRRNTGQDEEQKSIADRVFGDNKNRRKRMDKGDECDE